ncbi:adenosylmethionine decarboxylase [Paraburkholderia sp. EG304]|uniref:adenosylmethionine decarboxylase n=1 Tax=Paraburkholderia sp. EG304 TaxID=3237015 RepID=UPI00397A1630
MECQQKPIGRHLLVDMHQVEKVNDPSFIEDVLRRSAIAAGAHVLEASLHVFPPYNGVTGVVLLAESHISIHTWPELSFAAFDIFMCGAANVRTALDILVESFEPKDWVVVEHIRGAMHSAGPSGMVTAKTSSLLTE